MLSVITTSERFAINMNQLDIELLRNMRYQSIKEVIKLLRVNQVKHPRKRVMRGNAMRQRQKGR